MRLAVIALALLVLILAALLVLWLWERRPGVRFGVKTGLAMLALYRRSRRMRQIRRRGL